MSRFAPRVIGIVTGGWRGNEKGTVTVMVVALLAVFVGFIGLALDSGFLFRHLRVMQTAADAGALAGATEIHRAQPSLVVGASAQGATVTNGFTNGSNTVVVTVHHPPVSGFYVGNSQYVEVLISQNVPSFFIKILGFASTMVPARAVAGVGPPSRTCIHTLNPTAEKTLSVTSNSVLTAPGCNIVDNSNAYNAFNIESGSVFASDSIAVTGGSNVTSGSSATPAPTVGVPPALDPLAQMMFPSYGACTHFGFKVSSGTFTINPGVYCPSSPGGSDGGIQIASGATATFTAGMYILVDGGLQVDSGSTVSGSGVTFFNTSTGGGDKFQPIRLKSGSSANFSAPTTGPWANILFFQDRNAGAPGVKYENEISSDIQAVFSGVMYFPTQTLKLATSNSNVTINGAIIASIVEVSSTSTVTVNNVFSGASPLKRLSLVE